MERGAIFKINLPLGKEHLQEKRIGKDAPFTNLIMRIQKYIYTNEGDILKPNL
jgi:hypothetical protein